MPLNDDLRAQLAHLPAGAHLRVAIGTRECALERFGTQPVAWVATRLDTADLVPALLDVAEHFPGVAQVLTLASDTFACLLDCASDDTLAAFVERYAGRTGAELGLPPAGRFTSPGARS